MVRDNPDPNLVLGVPPAATQAEITHAYRPGCAPITPTHVRHYRRKPPTNGYGSCWPPMPCCVTPARQADYDRATADAANTRPRIPAVPTPADGPSSGRAQIPITHRHNNLPPTQVPVRAAIVRKTLRTPESR